MVFHSIQKRDGSLAEFDPRRIQDAIHRAFVAEWLKESGEAASLTGEVVNRLASCYPDTPPTVENIQDLVVEVLREQKFVSIANAYQHYRDQKKEIRQLRSSLGFEAGKLSINALEVLRQRYLLHDTDGHVAETPGDLFHRVAHAVARVEKRYGKHPQTVETPFLDLMTRLEFMPNSPTLFNAGTPMGQLSACFVLPVHDSLESIFTTVKHTALIAQTGGGVGFDFSELRPNGDIVQSTRGVASGPVSFMQVFDTTANVIKTGGRRRGALMGVLRVDHPDILEFIAAKQKTGVLSNFNISVAVTDEFLECMTSNREYLLRNPRTGTPSGSLNAGEVWDQIMRSAWASGDPGVIFLDEVNRHNPTPAIGQIAATNPCGEQPLLPFESCNLGSINLARMVHDREIQWDKLRDAVETGVHFLDNVVDANKYPLPEIEAITRANRKVGLGVMGWADLLIQLGIPYDTEDALALADRLMKFIQQESHQVSQDIGGSRGSFPNFAGSLWSGLVPAMRNATVTTVAPTGTISIIAGCSSGIEPIFAIAFMRKVLNGTRLFEVHPYFETLAKERGFYSGPLFQKIARSGSVRDIGEVPPDVRRLFATAIEIAPEWHVRMQAAFQSHVDNAVSKTVNLPASATIEDARKIYTLAWKLKCKGITIFRYGSKADQVLYAGGLELKEKEFASAEAEFTGGCPTCTYYLPNLHPQQ